MTLLNTLTTILAILSCSFVGVCQILLMAYVWKSTRHVQQAAMEQCNLLTGAILGIKNADVAQAWQRTMAQQKAERDAKVGQTDHELAEYEDENLV